jgi:hypothetical protein
MPTNIDRSRLVSGANKALLEGLGSRYRDSGKHGALRTEQIARGLETFSDATLSLIVCMRSDPEYWLHCGVIEIAISGKDFSDEALISDYLRLAHCFSETDDTDRFVQAVLAFEALEYYDGLTPQNEDFSCPQQRVDQCTAIITIAQHLKQAYDAMLTDDDAVHTEQFRGNRHEGFNYLVTQLSDETLYIIGDKTLRNLLTEHGPDLVGITAAVTERNLTNVEDILGIIEAQKTSPAQAIRAGVL